MSNKYKFKNPDGIYFISPTVVDWVDVFIRTIYKEILLDSIRYCQREKGLVVHAWVIMSSHFHMIVSRKSDTLLEEILRDMKKFTSFKLLQAIKENGSESRQEWMLKLFSQHGGKNSNNSKFQFWQQDNHPVELSTNEMMDQRLDYIHNNPVEAGYVEFPEEYLYSSARDYCGRKGLLDVQLLE